MSWTRSLLLNIAGGVLVVLLVGNFALALVNNRQNDQFNVLQQDIQKNRATLGQAQEASTRVVKYLQVLAGQLNQANQIDPQFKAAITAADTTGIYSKFQDIVQKAIAAAQAAQAAQSAASPAPAPQPSPATP